MQLNRKTAVILFNLGGPDNLQSVKPFLFNLFNDKAIISIPQPFRFLLAKLISSRREKTAQEIYSQLGGKSPIFEITSNQADALEKELSYFGNFKVFTIMRYWKPFAKDVMKQILKYNPEQIIMLPLYPQFSSTTSNSSIKNFIDEFNLLKNKFNKNLKSKIVCCYPTEENFIKSHALLIKKTLVKANDENLDNFRFLFSAHGLPQKIINNGDPYVFQVEKTTQAVIKNLAEILKIEKTKIDFQICFQSKVGPLKWTSPSLEQALKEVAIDNKIPVIIPIAFVSEHSETLVELDIEYKEKAEKLGIKKYFRVSALNSDGHFIKSLAEICLKIDKNNDYKIFSGSQPIRICNKKMKLCFNENDECAN